MMLNQLIGKRVRVRINDRDNFGKTLHNKFTYISGICKFAGYNKYLDVYQITVDRTPIYPIQFKDVTILT
jgi:hypothetical protein